MMNIQKNQEHSYQIGNCLTETHPTYVKRAADEELFNALKAGEYCYVLSSPQTGKSSLKVRTIQLLRAENIICITLDMTIVNNKILTLEEWYDQVILTLEKSFIFPRYFPELWWEEMADMPGDEKLFLFIEEVLLANTQDEKIVIFIDEVNDYSVFNPGASSLGVLISYCFQVRANNPQFKRLTFALLGITIPDNLVDVCRYIELSSFKIEEMSYFVNRFQGIVKQPLKFMEEILFWSGGQPFLTQKICQIVINYLGEIDGEKNDNDVALVEDLVTICVIENWDAQDYPAHFGKIQNMLLKNIEKSTSHLEIYQQLLKYGRLKPPGESHQRFKNDAIAHNKREIKELLRSGIAKINQGFLEVYSPIYAEIFNQEWVQKYLAQITKSASTVNGQKFELNNVNAQAETLQDEASISNFETPKNYKFHSNDEINSEQEILGNPLKLNYLNNQVTNFQLETNISDLGGEKNHKILSNDVLNSEQKQPQKMLDSNDFNSQVTNLNLGDNVSYLQIPDNHKILTNNLIQPQQKQQEIPEQKITHQENPNNQGSRKKGKQLANSRTRLNIGVAGLVAVFLVSITGGTWATKLFQDQQNQLQKAEYQLEKVKYELQEVQQGKKLEHQGINALRQFESAEIEALLSAMEAGIELQELVKNGSQLQYYPATSPIFALQQILNNIHEKNQIPNIKNIAMSPNDQLLAIVNNDGTAKIMKFSGQPISQLRGHQGKISQIKFAPEGDLLATAADDATARIWDFQGQQQVELKGHKGQIWEITFSPDGKLLATAGEDGTARIWDISGQKIAILKKHLGRILDITFSSDGKYLATAGWDGTARIWSRSGKQLAVLRGHRGSVEKVIFSPDGKYLATAGWDGTIRIWSRSSGKLLSKLKGKVGNISFSSDGKRLVTGGEDGTANIWNVSGQLLGKLPGHQGVVTSISFSPDGQRLATAGRDGNVKVWDNNGNLLANLKGHLGRVLEINFSSDRELLLTLGEDGTGRIWELEGNHEAKIKGDSDIFGALSFSPNGEKLVTMGVDGVARIWDISGKLLAELNGSLGMFGDMSFSFDGQHLATAGDSGQVRIWQVSGEELIGLKGQEGRVKQISFSFDGERLATVGEDGVARIWNNSGQQLVELKGHNGRVLDVNFSPDGKYIGTAGEDGIGKIWDSSFRLVLELGIVSGWMESIGFSPSGKYIATGDSNGMVKIWDSWGNQIADLKAHIGSVENVTFSADGKRVISMGKDGMVRIWDIMGQQVGQFENAQGLSLDGKYVATLADNDLQLWRVKGLNDLLRSSCDWLEDYFTTHPDVRKDLEVCQ